MLVFLLIDYPVSCMVVVVVRWFVGMSVDWLGLSWLVSCFWGLVGGLNR